MSIALRKKNLKSGKVSYYLDIHAGGKRFYEFLDIQADPDDAVALKQAEDMMNHRLSELNEQPERVVPTFKRRSNFVAYFEKLIDDKPKTEKAWRNTAKYLRRFNTQISFAAIDEKWLDEFKMFLLENVSRNTAHTYFSKIKAALKRAKKEGILSIDPAVNVPNIEKTQPERVFLSEQELVNLRQANCKNENVKLAFLFACFTGLTLQVVESLTWTNIKKGSHGHYIEFEEKTTSGLDALPLSIEAEQVINKLSQSNGIVEAFSSHPEALLFVMPSRSEIQNCLNAWVSDAGLDKHISFRVSRHTYATRSLSNGTDIYTLSRFLGHKTVEVTKIYQRNIAS